MVEFENDFEDDLASWTEARTSGTGQVSISTANPKKGTKHLDAKIFAVGDVAYAYKSFTARKEYYARAYIYFEKLPNIAEDNGAVRVLGLYGTLPPDTKSSPVFGLQRKAGVLKFAAKARTAEATPSYPEFVVDDPLPEAGKWYCVEIYSKRGTGAKVMVWIDGVLVIDQTLSGTDADDTLPTLNNLRCGIHAVTGCTTNFECEVFVDAVVVSTEPIGVIPPPPAPPTLAETITTMMTSIISITMVVLLIRIMLSMLKSIKTK
jgi:hypothetical protein